MGVKYDQSICAYDPRNNNKIVGIRLASGPYSPRRRKPKMGDGIKRPLQLAQAYRIIECLLFGSNDVVESYAGYEKFMKGMMVCVDEEYHQLGLGGALMHKSWDLAKEARCKFVFAELSSAYSAKIFAKVGANIIKEIQYSEYTYSVSGKKIITPEFLC